MSVSDFIQQAEALRDRVLKPAWSPMKPRGPVTVLDWDGRVLRVAQTVPRDGGAEITTFATERLDPGCVLSDAASLGGGIRQALQRLRIKPSQVVMGIPRGAVFLRALVLPKVGSREELAAMVHFQIAKDLPFRLEEAVVDFQVNETPEPAANPTTGNPADAGARVAPNPDKLDVLVAVVKREAVDHCRAVAAAAGFKLAALALNSAANARCVQACHPAESPQAMALVSLRQEETVVDVVVDGTLVFSRTAPVAEASPEAKPEELPVQKKPRAAAKSTPPQLSGDPAGFAATLEAALIEVVRGLHNYEGLERHVPVRKILVACAAGPGTKTVEALTRQTGIPCEPLNPAGRLGLKLQELGAEAATVIGLAFGAHDRAGLPFDFLNPKRLPVQRNWRRLKMAGAAGAAAILVLGVLAVRTRLVHQRTQIRDQLQTQLNLAATHRALYRDLRTKSKNVHGWTLEKREWLDHYAFLSALLPASPEMYITSFSTGARGVVHLSVQARNGDTLAQIDKRLREAGYDLKPLAITPSSDRYGYGFQSSLELTLPDKVNLDLSQLKPPVRPANDASLDPPRPRRKPETPPAVAAPAPVPAPRPGQFTPAPAPAPSPSQASPAPAPTPGPSQAMPGRRGERRNRP